MFDGGEFRLFNSDWRKFVNEIPDGSVDLVYTDPPYDVHVLKDNEVDKSGLVYASKPINVVQSGGFDLNEFCEGVWPKMKVPNIYVWCGKRQIVDYVNFFVNRKKLKFDPLFWFKTNALPTFSNKYLSDVEYCLYFHESGLVHPKCWEDAKTVYYSPLSKSQQDFGHPNVKPLEFVKAHIRNSSNEGEVVFDPFMGSGTTGEACKELGRKFIGCEINESYYKIAESRINGSTYVKGRVGKPLF